MGWLQTIAPRDAKGLLAKLYDEGVQRAGRVYGIVRAMSLSPRILRSSMLLYSDIMQKPGALSRRRREMLAVVVSASNECHY